MIGLGKWDCQSFEYTINYNPTIIEKEKFNPNKNQASAMLYHREYRPNMSGISIARLYWSIAKYKNTN
jgi:hypothetical protein